MPATIQCPTCRSTFPLPAGAGPRIECPKCFESFNHAAPAAPPVAKIPAAQIGAAKKKPAREEAPIPLAEVADDDDVPVVKPVAPAATPARPVAKVVATAVPDENPKPKPKPKPAATAPAARKTTGAPRARRKDDDDDDEPRRKPKSGWPVVAAGVAGLVLIGACAVAAISYLRPGKTPDTVAAPPPQPTRVVTAPPELEPKPNPPEVWPAPVGAPAPVGGPAQVGGPAAPPVQPPPPPAPVEPPAPPKPILVPAAEVVEIRPTAAPDGATAALPSATDLVCVGGGGRFLIFRLPADRQIAVFDANVGKVVRYLPLAESSGVMAAGMTKLFVLLPDANVIQRWNLLTFEKELSVASPFSGEVKAVVMGHQTDGPLYVSGPNQFLDTATLQPVALPKRPNGWNSTPGGGRSVRVSADGRVYAWWNPDVSPSGLNALVLTDGVPKVANEHTTVGAITPGPDGTLFTGGGLYTPELKKIGANQRGYQYWHLPPVPAVHGPFYLTPTGMEWDSGGAKGTPGLVLQMLGSDRPLVTLTALHGLTLKTSQPGANQATPLTDRVFLIPDAKLLVVLGDDNKTLHLNAFDAKARMDAAGIDYLVVASRPHPAATGKNYRYVPDVWSKKGGVKIKLDAGPDGMKVVGNSVTWKVPADFTGVADVILTVSDASGQETFHSFKLPVSDKVPEGGPPVRAAPPLPPVAVAPAKDPPPAEPIAAAPPRRPPTPAKLKEASKEVKLPGAFDAVAAAGGGHVLLLRLPASKQIAVFDAREAAVVKYLPLAEAGALVAGGRDHAFVYAPGAGAIQRWNLATFEKELTVASPVSFKVEKLLHGANATGPLILVGGDRGQGSAAMLDPLTLKPIDLAAPAGARGRGALGEVGTQHTVRLSADGRLLTAYNPHQSPMGHTAVTFAGGASKSAAVGGWGDIYGHAAPSPDGKQIFTAHGVFTAEGKHTLTGGGTGRGGGYFYTLPPAEPVPVFLSVTSAGFPHGDKTPAKLHLHLPNERTPAAELTPVKLPPGINVWGREPLGTDQRVHFVPSADAVVVLPETNDRVAMYRVNLKDVLDKSGKDYLFVTSSPPAAVAGKSFRYAPDVTSKKGGVKIKLDAGPDGMAVAGNAVTWAVPAAFGEKTANVILTVSDAGGQETFHSFELPVQPDK